MSRAAASLESQPCPRFDVFIFRTELHDHPVSTRGDETRRSGAMPSRRDRQVRPIRDHCRVTLLGEIQAAAVDSTDPLSDLLRNRQVLAARRRLSGPVKV